MGFEDDSYARHAAEFRPYSAQGAMGAHARTWLDAGTVDAWRHQRMYRTLDPLIASFPASTWLTVGDGRYGKDARYLLDSGRAAVATDISEVLLREAAEAGFIEKWSVENAERLSFPDDSFDFALCKESYHHFPRPMVALYEMLRVAREGIVLIEPNDFYVPRGMLAVLAREAKNAVNWLLGKRHIRAEYEESGNYVFRISRRELEKVALGLNYRAVAFKPFNDAFLPGVEKERIEQPGPLYRKLRLLIGAKNLLCRLGVMDYGLMTAVIFKATPSRECIEMHRAAGFEFRLLDPNPYA
jgi:ubiquinone/menaquinone biosynthesis C-methylase UbiE